MEIYVKKHFFDFHIFFRFSVMILSSTLILPMSQLRTQQLMTTQIRSHKYKHSCYHFILKDEKCSRTGGF